MQVHLEKSIPQAIPKFSALWLNHDCSPKSPDRFLVVSSLKEVRYPAAQLSIFLWNILLPPSATASRTQAPKASTRSFNEPRPGSGLPQP
jgi:hypothetical protein